MDDTKSPHYLTGTDMAELVRRIEAEKEDDWQRFLRFSEEIDCAAGDVLIRQFDMGRDVFALTSGKLEVRVADAPGESEMVIATVSPFAIVGEQSFLDEGVRTATVAAAEPSVVHRLTFAGFEELCEGAPDLAIAFLFDIARTLSLRDRVNQV